MSFKFDISKGPVVAPEMLIRIAKHSRSVAKPFFPMERRSFTVY